MNNTKAIPGDRGGFFNVVSLEMKEKGFILSVI